MLCFLDSLFSGLELQGTIVTRGFNSIGKKKEQKKQEVFRLPVFKFLPVFYKVTVNVVPLPGTLITSICP